MNAINGTGKISLTTIPLAERLEARDPSFAQRLQSAIGEVNTNQQIADESVEKVIKGELGIHEAMMALGKADTSLKLIVAVKSKVMDAYNEIMRMQI